MVFPPNGQYILLCPPVPVILRAFCLSARHDLLTGLDQEFSSCARARAGAYVHARERTNARGSIKKLPHRMRSFIAADIIGSYFRMSRR
jgi:hypothetical protein